MAFTGYFGRWYGPKRNTFGSFLDTADTSTRDNFGLDNGTEETDAARQNAWNGFRTQVGNTAALRQFLNRRQGDISGAYWTARNTTPNDQTPPRFADFLGGFDQNKAWWEADPLEAGRPNQFWRTRFN